MLTSEIHATEKLQIYTKLLAVHKKSFKIGKKISKI